MVFRLSGSAPQTRSLNFDGNAIAQSGQVSAAGLTAGLGALDDYLQKEAELFYQNEITDFNIDMDNTLRDIATQTLGGEGFSDAANLAYDARRDQVMERAGSNPYRQALLNRHFSQTDAQVRQGFSEQQLDLAVEYGITTIGRNIDDAMQRAGRGNYVAPEITVSADRSQFDLAELSLGTRAVNRPGGGITNISLDYNASAGGGARGTEVIIPDNASPELRAAAETFNSLMVDFAERRGISYPNRGVRTRSENGRGVSGTVHVEPFFNDDIELQNAILDNFDEFAQIYEVAFGGLSNVRIIPPHGVGNDRGAASSVFQSETDFGKRVVQRLIDRRGNGDNITSAPPEMDQNGIPVYSGDLPDIWDNPDLAHDRDNIFAAIDAIPGITANRRDELRQMAEGGLTEAAIRRLAEENAPVALALLNSGQYDAALSYSEDRSLRTEMEKEITRAEQERQQRVRAEGLQLANDYIAWNGNGRQGAAPPQLTSEQYMSLTSAQRRTYDRADAIGRAVQQAQLIDLNNAEAFLQANRPSGSGYALQNDIYDAVEPVIRQRQMEATAQSEVDISQQFGLPPNTDIEGVEDILDQKFVEAIDGEGDPFLAAANFIEQHRFVPEGFATMVGRAMGSDDPAMKQAAINAVATLNAANPRLLADISNPAIDRAIAMSGLMDQTFSLDEAEQRTIGYVSPSEAAERDRNLANWNNDELNLQEQAWEMLRERIAQRGKEQGLGRSDANAAIPPGVWDAFADQVRDEYSITGNLDVAVQTAERWFFSRYAVSYIGGEPAWQFGAAEATYPLYSDPVRQSSWIEMQARDVAEFALGGEVESLRLAPVNDPIRADRPEYQIIAIDADGRSQIVPGTFVPDRQSEIDLARRTERFPRGSLTQEQRTVDVLTLELQRNEIRMHQLLDQAMAEGLTVADGGPVIEELEQVLERKRELLAQRREGLSQVSDRERELLEQQRDREREAALGTNPEMPPIPATEPTEPIPQPYGVSPFAGVPGQPVSAPDLSGEN